MLAPSTRSSFALWPTSFLATRPGALLLVVSACTTTADPTIIDGTAVSATYDVALSANPLGACATPADDGTERVAAVELRGSARLLVQLVASPAVTLRPTGGCSGVSTACGHFNVLVDSQTTPILTASSIVEIPLASLGTHTFKVTLVGDDGAPLYTSAQTAIATPVTSVEVVAPDATDCH